MKKFVISVLMTVLVLFFSCASSPAPEKTADPVRDSTAQNVIPPQPESENREFTGISVDPDEQYPALTEIPHDGAPEEITAEDDNLAEKEPPEEDDIIAEKETPEEDDTLAEKEPPEEDDILAEKEPPEEDDIILVTEAEIVEDPPVGEESDSRENEILLTQTEIPAPPPAAVQQTPSAVPPPAAPPPAALLPVPSASIPAPLSGDGPVEELVSPEAGERERVLPIIPEMPYPSTGITGRNDEIVFSRTVRATVGQYVEIPFQGSGWVYLGEIASRRGIVFDSRRLDTDGQNFIFRVESPGVYALKFFRQDFVRNFILNDHVQIIAGEAPVVSGAGSLNPPLERSRVVAEPRWPANPSGESSARGRPQQEARNTAAPVDLPSAVPPAAVPAAPEAPPPPAIISVTDFIARAKEEFDAGQISSAISLLDQFRGLYPSGSDEAWWLYGQCYEANSPARNVLGAMDYYRRLVRDFPQSDHCDEARRRISYLERYYINIR